MRQSAKHNTDHENMACIFLLLVTFSLVNCSSNYVEHKNNFQSINWWNKKTETVEVITIPCLEVCTCTDNLANCSSLGLNQVPGGRGEVIFIETLDLSNNNLEKFPVQFLQQFKQLKHLLLGYNKISDISQNSFSSIRHLISLDLQRNNIEQLQDKIFIGNKDLTILNLAYNEIISVDRQAFKGLEQLNILKLEGNPIKELDSDTFQDLGALTTLEINKNELSKVPEGLHMLPSLQRISLARNKIVNIPDKIFINKKNLQYIELVGNPIDSFHQNAFVDLPKLRKLQITSDLVGVNVFPNLTGTMSLELVELNRANIQLIPSNLCSLLPNLNILRLRSNRIKELPVFTECQNLRQIDLGSNRIRKLDGSPFQNLGQLKDLLLDHNKLSSLSSEVFQGLENLHVLTLENNNISEIHKDSFAPLKSIKDLNLGQNSFPEIPHLGLKTLVELKTHSNPNLKEFPGPEMFPNLQILRVSYAYHCCQFIPPTLQKSVPGNSDLSQLEETVYFPGEIDMSQFSDQSLSSVNWNDGSGNITNDYEDLWKNFDFGLDYTDISFNNETSIGVFKHQGGVDCYPAPGPFLPCNDLFDWWTLRCSIWVVFLLALLGNGCVVFVFTFSRGRIDVPKFLVCNLAMADFFMGLYLGFLAIEDASTLGAFEKHAIQWQLSGACQAAGFFGVLSSELSVFTLSVITLERNYAITHAMHLNKRLSLRHAAYIMVGGWSFSILMATLPIVGVSDYRKFAVCLPFQTETALDLGYVVFLIFINGGAFFILMGCYLKMYLSIRGSQAWNSNDSRIARRMALLVFTDFLCWFPIGFFALTAASGADIISLEGAKVLTVFILPFNSCCNPFLYAILTKQFKKDCILICKSIEESRVTRGIGRCHHSSNFSNRQTPVHTHNSLNSGSNSGSNTKNSCSCNLKKHPQTVSPSWPLDKIKSLLCGVKNPDENIIQNDWYQQISKIQRKQQQTIKRNASTTSESFCSSRLNSYKRGNTIPLRLINNHQQRHPVTRNPSQTSSHLSSSRTDSAASNLTQSTDLASSLSGQSITRINSGNRENATRNRENKKTGLMDRIMRRGTTGQLLDHHSAVQIHQMERKPMLERQMAVDGNEVTISGSQLGDEVPGDKEMYVKGEVSSKEETGSDQ